MITNRCSRVLAVFCLVLLSGCALNRSEIALPLPEANSNQYASTEQTIVIGEVIDRRVFEESPINPSTPSLGKGGASKASDQTKARAIGRKKNKYGYAIGDVLLENGQTVDSVVRSNLALALNESGYSVLPQSAVAAANSPVIDVYIDEFWGWLTPGLETTLNTRISTTLELRSSETQESILVRTRQIRPFATNAAWIELFEKALNDYRNEVISIAPDLLEE